MFAKQGDAIREPTSRNGIGRDEEYIVGELNQKLVGLAKNFDVDEVSKA
jgi:hypothetical protein